MLTLFSSSHIGAPQMCTNMAFSYWPLKISVKHFDEYLKFGEICRPKTWRSVFFIYLPSQFLDFIHLFYFLLRDSEKKTILHIQKCIGKDNIIFQSQSHFNL